VDPKVGDQGRLLSMKDITSIIIGITLCAFVGCHRSERAPAINNGVGNQYLHGFEEGVRHGIEEIKFNYRIDDTFIGKTSDWLRGYREGIEAIHNSWRANAENNAN